MKSLDLRYASIAVGQFNRDHSGGKRQFEVGLRVWRDIKRVFQIAVAQGNQSVRHGAVNANPHLADRAAVRRQMGVVEKKVAIPLAQMEPVAAGLFQRSTLVAFEFYDRIEGNWKWPDRIAIEIHRPYLDGRRILVRVEYEAEIGHPPPGALVERIAKAGLLERAGPAETPRDGGNRPNE